MKVIKQVDVVISTVGHLQLADQVKIIAAIKEAGNVKVVLFILCNSDQHQPLICFSAFTFLFFKGIKNEIILHPLN